MRSGRRELPKFPSNSPSALSDLHEYLRPKKKPLKIEGFRVSAERGGFEPPIGYDPFSRLGTCGDQGVSRSFISSSVGPGIPRRLASSWRRRAVTLRI